MRKACRSGAGASDLQAFQVFPLHPKLICYASKPIENLCNNYNNYIVSGSNFEGIYCRSNS